MLHQIIKLCDAVSEWTGRILSHFIWITMGFCVFEVISRRFFNSPTIWSQDVIHMFYALHFILLGGFTLLKHGHVSVDIFSTRLSKRYQAFIQIITYAIFFFPFFIVIFLVGYKSAFRSWSDFEKTMVGLPYITPIIKTAIPVAAALLLIQGVSEFIKNVRLLKGGRPDA